MVEFDVRAWRGELVLAHTIVDARLGRSVSLSDALSHLAGMRFRDVELNVDVKHAGFEQQLLDMLDGAAELKRTLVSSQIPAVIDRVDVLEPRARTRRARGHDGGPAGVRNGLTRQLGAVRLLNRLTS